MDIETDELEAQVKKHLEGVRIPPVPSILHILNKEVQKDYPDIATIKDAIKKDISTAALVLKTVNSSFFGLKVKVTSIGVALNILGINNTVNIVMGIVLATAFKEEKQVPLNFWESPSNIALVAASLAKQLNLASPDDAYVVGLFHNAGHVLMLQKYPDYNDFLLAHYNDSNEKITTLEDKTYESDHATLGFYLASAWGLPKHMKLAILHHHNISDFLSYGSAQNSNESNPINNLLSLLKMAEHIDKAFWGMIPDFEWQRVGENVLGYLGLSEEDFEDIKADMLEQLQLKS